MGISGLTLRRGKLDRVESRGTRELAPKPGAWGDGDIAAPTGWQSPITLPWIWMFGGLVVSALFGLGVHLFSHDDLHKLWGLSAACAYGIGALAVLIWRLRGTIGVDLALVARVGGAILVPLIWLIATGHV